MSDEQLNRIEEAIGAQRDDMTSLKGDMTSLKGDMTSLKGDMTSLKGDMTSLKGDMTSLKGDMTSLRMEVTSVRADMTAGFERVDRRIDDTETRLRILVEGLRDDVRILAEHFNPLEQRVTALERRLPPR
jgi:chromosome segregation ATPase